MFILELVNKDSEGTWSNNICVSNDIEKLKERSIIEREKTIQDPGYHRGAQHLFKVGDLEEYIATLIKLAQESFIGNDYYIDGQKIGNYKDLRAYMEVKAEPLAQSLGVDSRTLSYVVNQGFYQSLRFQIREIEEI
jgi:hypothetical protein